MRTTKIVALALLFIFATIGFAQDPAPAAKEETKAAPAKEETKAPPAKAAKVKFERIKTIESPKDQTPKSKEVAIINVEGFGRIVLGFFPDKAPNHVKNFIKLAKAGFFDGTTFHRIIPGFMIQGGDPNSKDDDPSNDGMGGSPDKVNAEFNDLHHLPGTLSMARTNDPNSATSQFFICHKAAQQLDHQYTIFGQVLSGMDVVDKIASAPRGAQDNPFAADSPKRQKIAMKVTIAKWADVAPEGSKPAKDKAPEAEKAPADDKK